MGSCNQKGRAVIIGWNDHLDDPNAYVDYIDRQLAAGEALRKERTITGRVRPDPNLQDIDPKIERILEGAFPPEINNKNGDYSTIEKRLIEDD